MAPTASQPTEAKRASYYANKREDLIAALPRPLGRVLDIGCGSGEVGEGLRAAGAESIVGIEMDPDAAASAAEIYDSVLVGTFEEKIDELTGTFDSILFYDVLEHMYDPWSALRKAKEIASPGGRVHVSVPNARHASLFLDVFVKGTFERNEWGLRDSTHIRWFTRRDITESVADAGWDVSQVSHSETPRYREVLGKATGGRALEFLVTQWYVLATSQY